MRPRAFWRSLRSARWRSLMKPLPCTARLGELSRLGSDSSDLDATSHGSAARAPGAPARPGADGDGVNFQRDAAGNLLRLSSDLSDLDATSCGLEALDLGAQAQPDETKLHALHGWGTVLPVQRSERAGGARTCSGTRCVGIGVRRYSKPVASASLNAIGATHR